MTTWQWYRPSVNRLVTFLALPLLACTDLGILPLKGGDDTGGDTAAIPSAGNYAGPGVWTAGQDWSEITGSRGDTLYVSTWFPSGDVGGIRPITDGPTGGPKGRATPMSPQPAIRLGPSWCTATETRH